MYQLCVCTLSNWQGVCPKLLIMPSRALRSFSSVMASRSTAPATSNEQSKHYSYSNKYFKRLSIKYG